MKEKTFEICGEVYAEEFWQSYLTEVENADEFIDCCKGECAKVAQERLHENKAEEK